MYPGQFNSFDKVRGWVEGRQEVPRKWEEVTFKEEFFAVFRLPPEIIAEFRIRRRRLIRKRSLLGRILIRDKILRNVS